MTEERKTRRKRCKEHSSLCEDAGTHELRINGVIFNPFFTGHECKTCVKELLAPTLIDLIESDVVDTSGEKLKVYWSEYHNLGVVRKNQAAYLLLCAGIFTRDKKNSFTVTDSGKPVDLGFSPGSEVYFTNGKDAIAFKDSFVKKNRMEVTTPK